MARPVPRLQTGIQEVDRSLQAHRLALQELQEAVLTEAVVVPTSLPDATDVEVRHGLGRLPVWVAPSAVRNASSSGRIEEIRDTNRDRRKVVVLRATGWGATIDVDVVVV